MWGRRIAIVCLVAAGLAAGLWALSAFRLARFSMPLGMRNRAQFLSGYGVVTLGFNRAQQQPYFSTIIYLKSPDAMTALANRERDKGLPTVDFDLIKSFSIGHFTEKLPDGSIRDAWQLSLPYWLITLLFLGYPGVRGARYWLTPRCRNCRAELTGETGDDCPACGYPIPSAVRARLAKLARH